MGVGMIEGISRTYEVQFSSGDAEVEKNEEVSKNVISVETMYR